MKQLIRHRTGSRHLADRRRNRTGDPAVTAELAVIVEIRRAQPLAGTPLT